jgi:hypothetical protein
MKKINDLVAPAQNFYEIWSALIAQKQLFCGNIYPSKWYAVDTMEQLKNLSF